MNRNITKAQQVHLAYDAAERENLYTKDCYERAINAARALGGIEMYNRSMTETRASKVSFVFDDESSLDIKYSGVNLIKGLK